jgi:hypothetical protein
MRGAQQHQLQQFAPPPPSSGDGSSSFSSSSSESSAMRLFKFSMANMQQQTPK